ncbi:MAG: alpha/beta fold hydrolase [Azonexus sp.]|jgi:predicted alpha/beta hydrolase|nr:alpha/beta fold hydrolase [Azonexus sp.]
MGKPREQAVARCANEGESITISARDGYSLHASVWAFDAQPRYSPRPVVIINPATSVHSRYYARFAAFLHANGFDVVTYDYRGIGGSRPKTLRGFDAGWIEWGTLDFEGVLRFVAQRFPGQPVQVVAHSVGGFLVGLAESNHLVSRVFTMGAQFAYWKDYARHQRLSMLWRWHVVMPALAHVFGYFPGKRLGWLEDTPRGVVHDWTARHPRFEDAYRKGRRAMTAEQRLQLVERFCQVKGETLALSMTDDAFGTIPAIHRLLGYFQNSPARHLRIAPGALGLSEIGHFAFFQSRFEDSLWPIPLSWLRDARVPDNAPGEMISPRLKR